MSEQINLSIGTINLNKDLLEKLQQYLSADNYRPKNLKEFNQKNPQFNPLIIEDVTTILVYAGKILPCQSEDAINKTVPRCHSLNKYICERAKFADEVQFLASPVTGGGVPVNRFERIFTAAIFDGKNTADEIAEYAWKIFQSQGQTLVIQGKALQTAEENIAEFKNGIKPFLENRLPSLKILQVV